jgi:hypothetical protein
MLVVVHVPLCSIGRGPGILQRLCLALLVVVVCGSTSAETELGSISSDHFCLAAGHVVVHIVNSA